MPSGCAKLRSDLVVSWQGTPGASGLVVKDPAAGRFFRFRETEGCVLGQLDGTVPLELVRQRVEERFGAALSLEDLQQFVDKLRGSGLLEAEGAPGWAPPPQGRVRGNLFYLRLKAFDPDHLFERLVGKVRFFFTPHFVLLSALLVLLALGITLTDWAQIVRESRDLFHFHSLLLAWVVLLLIIGFHEFAHGLTCKHYGGKVHELGFMLIYFQPAFYCNVSDAWLFPEKAKRLWVTFAGAYFELFLWALATVVWRLTDPSTTINFAALLVTITSAVKSFFNLNPLIKLDGYYLLSDLLEIPNLRARAFGYLGDQFRRLWGSTTRKVENATPRERWIYLVYGLLAGFYSYWLLGFIVLQSGSFLVERYQGWGFALFSALVAGVFHRPIKRGSQMISSMSKSLQAPVALLKRRPLASLGLAIVLGALFFSRLELKVAGEFTILPIHNADVRATVEGIIQEICVRQGDLVRRGVPIARLAGRDYLAERQKTAAEIAEKEARLALLKAGPRAEEVELAKTLIAKAEERLHYARRDLDRKRVLSEKNFIPQRDFEEAEEAWALRKKELEEAANRLEVLSAGSRQEELEAAQAEIDRLRVQQHYLEDQLHSLTVVSPIAGVVTTHRLEEKIGQRVNSGELIAEVHDLQTVTAEIAIPEKEIADVEMGQRVVLKTRAHPQLSFRGRVSAIAPVATARDEWGGERVILVSTQLDNASLLLKPEMSGNAKVYCGQRRLIDLVTRRAIRFLRVEFWSWW